MEDQEQEQEEQEYYEHHNVVVDPGQTLLRIDKFLQDKLSISRNKIQQAAKADCLLVNQSPVKSNYKVKPSDEISLVLPFPKREFELIPQDIPLDIVYEDEEVVVVNKPAGMVVHPGHGNYDGTLVNGLMHHFQSLPDKSELQDRPGLVHRIDKDTTGLLVIGKSEHTLMHLSKQFFDRTTSRRYHALVWGDLAEDEGTITGHIGRSPKDRKVMAVYPEGEEGKHAVTHYKVLERFGYVTLVECKLETGRTHQIRVHFQYIGHPLFNDPWYGGDRIVKGTSFSKYKQFVENCFKVIPRQSLHAKSLGFTHPKTGERIELEVDLPEDMIEVLEKWRRYTSGQTQGLN